MINASLGASTKEIETTDAVEIVGIPVVETVGTPNVGVIGMIAVEATATTETAVEATATTRTAAEATATTRTAIVTVIATGVAAPIPTSVTTAMTEVEDATVVALGHAPTRRRTVRPTR